MNVMKVYFVCLRTKCWEYYLYLKKETVRWVEKELCNEELNKFDVVSDDLLLVSLN